MLIQPLPGSDRRRVRDALREVSTDLVNLRSGGAERFGRYLDWATVSASKLGSLVTSDDLDRLVLTKRYWALQSMVPSNSPVNIHPTVLRSLDVELDTQARLFESAEKALRDQIDRWTRAGEFFVPDTSFYIQSPAKLEDVDLPATLGTDLQPVHLIVPLVVVDELDRLKESHDRRVRWRAGYTLAVLDKRLPRAIEIGVLQAATASSSEVTVEVLFDQPRHVRLPVADDEIVDRVASTEVLAGRRITVVTYDTGQSMRARSVGLRTLKLDQERGDEPDP